MKNLITDRRIAEYKILSSEQLEKLTTGRLLNILKDVRAIKGQIYHGYICVCCDEFLYGTEEDYKKEVKPFEDYFNLLKKILSTRPHVELNRRKKNGRGIEPIKKSRSGS